jgi:DNA-binding HxlR family transcriptional regulator
MIYTKNGRPSIAPSRQHSIPLVASGNHSSSGTSATVSSGSLNYNGNSPSVNTKMLPRSFRKLEKDGVVWWKVYAEVPPRVDYGIAEFGRTLISVMEPLCAWGVGYLGIGVHTTCNCKATEEKERY